MGLSVCGVTSSAQLSSFDRALRLSSEIEGFLTDAQARRLFDRAAGVTPPASIVEIGSWCGRSTVILAQACSAGVEVVAIDPHSTGPYSAATDREGERVHQQFHANLERAGVANRIRHIRLRSQEPDARQAVRTPSPLVYVDGDHRYEHARADIRIWGDQVSEGGALLVHDCFSSPYVTLAVLSELLLSAKFSFAGREGSLVEFRRGFYSPAQRVRSAARLSVQLPWLVRNLFVKVFLKLGFPAGARALGHREPGWPF